MQEFKAWGKLINGTAPMFKIKIDTAGTYVFETMGSEGLGSATPTDTLLQLFDSNFNRLVIHDNKVDSNFSRIQRSLSTGTYYFSVSDAADSDGASGTSDSVGMVDNIKCYIIVEKSGELVGIQSNYSDYLREFYKIGDADKSYNCINYAFNDYGTNMGTCGWSSFDNYAESKNYIQDSYSNNCIVAYGNVNTMFHVAKIENGIVTAKHGLYWEVIQHSSYDSYLSNDYNIIKFYRKTS